MSIRHHIGFRFHFLFAIAFIVSIPFPYYILPDPGSYIAPYLSRLIHYSGELFSGSGHTAVYEVVSDSTGMYIQVLLLALFSLAIAVTAGLVSRTVPSARVKYRFTVIISYYLSLQLLIYGFDKVFKHQFYLPEPNTLYTPLGYLSKDILYWSTMGSSYSYTVLSGLIEIIAAVLLLFKRTRRPAALLALGILCHVAMINFGFDISVKIYTCFLVYLSLMISFPALKQLFALFVLKKRVEPERDETAISTGYKKTISLLFKTAVIGCLFWEALYLHVVTHNYNDDKAPRPFLHGAYQVDHYIKNQDTLPPLLTDTAYIKRFFIHRQGYFITQGMNDELQDYRLQYDTAHQQFIVSSADAPGIVFHYQHIQKDSTLILTTTIRGDRVTLIARAIDLTSLPLLQPCFHWTSDDF